MKKVGQTPAGIMFHHFHGGNHPKSQGSMNADDLEAFISYVGRENILNADEFLTRALHRTLKKNHLCLTFDDNLRCQFDIALPVLQIHKIRAFWFVYTSVFEGKLERLEIYRFFRSTVFSNIEDFYKTFWATIAMSKDAQRVQEAVDGFNPKIYLTDFPFYTDEDRRFRFVRDDILGPKSYQTIMDNMITNSGLETKTLAENLWMSVSCLKQLSDEGHIIGLHSHTHPTRLALLDREKQEEEYKQNMLSVEQIIKKRVVSMSHPCNSYDHVTLDVLRSLGITIGFRANMALQHYSNLEIPREDHANIIAQMHAQKNGIEK